MRKYIYADEAGNFDFTRNRGASRYFILTTIAIEDHGIETELLQLRRELSWSGVELTREFHATVEEQAVRDRVFEAINLFNFRIDTTILDKPKAYERIRDSDESFYKHAWYYHMKYVAPLVATRDDELMVIAASIGTKRKERDFRFAVRDVMRQTSEAHDIRVNMWPAATDPCLQVADYCCWAIQRKWESNDSRSYDLIKNKIASEYNLFAAGVNLY